MAKNEWEVVSQVPEQKNANDEWEVVSQTPVQGAAKNDWEVVSKEPAWTQTYVPRKTEGPARTVEGKTYPPKQVKTATAPVADTDFDTGNAAGDDFGSAIMNAPQQYQSIMAGKKLPVLPTEDKAVLDPKFVLAVEAQFNAMPADKRQAALNEMVKRQDVYGRAARAIAGRYAAMDQNQTPTAKKFDPRLEAQTERFAEKQMINPEDYAKAQALSGRLMPDPQQMGVDVVGEQADIEAQKRAKELAGAGFTERVGAGISSQYTKAGLGLLQAYADLTGDDKFSADLNSARRIEEAREGAIPQGKSIFEKSAQGAMTSLGGQAPFLILGGLTGTSAPILAQAAIQQFGDSYGEGRASGLSGDKAAVRAIPTAAAEVFFERFGMTKALAGLKAHIAKYGAGSVPEYVARAIATELPSELATTATQYGIDALPEIGLNKNPSLLGLYQQLEETLRQTILQSGVTAGGTIGVVKGGQKIAKMLGPREGAYQQVDDYDKLVELAKSKGFLTPEQQQRQEQQKEPVAPAAEGQELPPDLLGDVRPSEDLKDDWEVESHTPATVPMEERVTQLAEEIQKRTNMPIESATRIAESRIAEEEKANAPAEKTVEGAKDVGQAITEPSGERTDLVEQPNTNAPTAGARVAEPDRVVSARPDVAGTVEPKGTQPAPVAPTLGEQVRQLTLDAQKEAGWNHDWPFVPVDLVHADFRNLIRNDPDIPVEVKNQIFEAGKKLDVVSKNEPPIKGAEKTPLPQGKTLTDELMDLRKAGKATNEDLAKVTSWMDANDEPRVFGKKLFDLINEIERRPSEEQKAAEVKPAEEIHAPIEETTPAEEDRRQAEQDAKVAEARNIAKTNFDTALDQVNDPEYGGDIDAVLDAYRQNTADTLGEQGKNDSILYADREFDRLVKEHKEKQEQPAPAAETPAEKKKRGRPPLERPEEQQQKIALNKKEQKKLTDKADYQLKKLKGVLDEAAKPLDGELEADKVDAAEEDKKKAKKYVATKLLELTLNPNLRGTVYADRAKAMLNDRSKLSEADINAAKRGMEIRAKTDLRGEIGGPAQGRNPLASRPAQSKDKANPAFYKAKNASQALGVIAKSGNLFQRFLANRLRGFVNGVDFVVLEKDSPIPAELQKHADLWESADAVYAPDNRTVYVRGESFGADHSIDNITVLHEILHAATDKRISLGLSARAKGTNPKLAKFVGDLIELSTHAGKQYELRKSIGWVPKDLMVRVESTKREDGTYGIFEEPHEFVAYGMSDETFQEFLGSIRSLKPQETGFTSFVRTLYDTWAKAFGRDAEGLSAMSDLINVTDKILSSEKPTSMRLEGGATPLASKRTGEEGALERTEAQQKEAVAKALNAVALSRAGEELGKSVSVAAALRDPRLVWREMKLAWGSMGDAKRSFFSHFYDLEAIAKGPGAQIKSLQDLYEAVQKKNGMTEVILRGAAAQSESLIRFFNAHPKFKDQFENLVHASTNAAYDPSKPNKHRDTVLDLMYHSLPERGQEAYRNLRDYYRDMKEFGDQIIADQIDKLDLPAGERDKIMAGIREIYEGEKSIDPYFPLMRYGDYILEIGKNDNRVSIRYETKMERDRAALEYAKKRNANLQDLRVSKEVKISDDIGSSKMRANIEGTSELLKAAYKAVDLANLTEPGAKESIKDNLYQAYLTSMPEASVRKMFMHRKGTPGFSSDVLRNVNSMGIKMSRQFAKLRYAPDMRNALSAANKVIETDPTYKAFVARANELAAEALQPPERTTLAKFMDTASGIVVKISYLRYMTSWSSAIMQPLDIFLKGIPTLLGNHGPKGVTALTKMLKIWNQFGIVEHQADGTTRWRMPSIEHATGLTPTERRAVREMVAWGVHKNTLASTVFNQSKKPTTNKVWQATKDVMGNLILGNLMHHGERLSREVVYLTSFRLNFDKSKNFDDAVKKAVAETNEVYGDYSPDNRPLIMRGATGKLVTMYKFFPLVTYKNLIGNFFKILSATNSPKEKVQAATKFFGVMGTHLLLGGLEALPMFSVVMSILGAAWNQWGRDPDAPDEMKNISYETWWKTKFMPQAFGDWSELLKKGAVNHLTGWDISSRISLNDMWFRAPTMPATTNKELMGNWALALAGPVPSLVLSTTQGLQEIANGQYERGLEKIMPGSISNLMIAHRYATEGFQTPQGVQLAQPGTMDRSEIAGQAIGYRPAAIATAQDIAFKSKVAEKVVLAEKNQLTRQYKDNFVKSTDPTMPVDFQQRFNEKWGDTLDKVIDFNIRHPKNQIDIEKLNESLSENIKAIVETEMGGGVRITPENVELLGDAANEAEKILSKYKKKE